MGYTFDLSDIQHNKTMALVNISLFLVIFISWQNFTSACDTSDPCCETNSCEKGECWWTCEDQCYRVGTPCNGTCPEDRQLCGKDICKPKAEMDGDSHADRWTCGDECVYCTTQCEGKCRDGWWLANCANPSGDCLLLREACGNRCADGYCKANGNECEKCSGSSKPEMVPLFFLLS